MLQLKSKKEKNLDNFKRFDTSDWEQVSKRITYRLINKKVFDNTDEYKDIIHKDCMDLTKVFMISEVSNDRKNVIIHDISENDLNMFGKTIDDIIESVKNNKNIDSIKRIQTLMQHTMSNEVLYPIMRVPDSAMLSVGNNGTITDTQEDKENVLIVTNKYNVYGASYMLDFNTLDDIYKRMNDNFYIIPQSAHSFMCISSEYACNNKSMKEAEDDMLDMLYRLNESNSRTEDILSYKIYKYIRDDGCALVPIKQSL